MDVGVAGPPQSSTPDLADPRWFLADLHVPERWCGMLRVDEDVIDRSNFLDTRIEAPLDQVVRCSVAQAAAATMRGGRIAWLFHTSFCASTLLARALHLAPFTVALKEPLVLRRLADARYRGWSLDGLVEPCVRLLGRPWHPDGAVVIKPTHVALNLAGDLLAATPGSRAVVVTCSLAEFLISNLKKPASSQAKIPELIERMLRASSFGARLSPAALRPPDMLCAAGLQWAATREIVRDVVASAGADRVRVLDMQPLLANLGDTVVECARWLQLRAPAAALAAHAREVGARNAKAMEVPYGPERRAYEASLVVHHHGEPLRRALEWLRNLVLPAMTPEAWATPAPWPASGRVASAS